MENKTGSVVRSFLGGHLVGFLVHGPEEDGSQEVLLLMLVPIRSTPFVALFAPIRKAIHGIHGQLFVHDIR